MPLKPYLKRIVEDRAVLTRDEARGLMRQILAGEPSGLQLAALLGAIAARGESAAEIAGFVDAMRAAAVPVPLTAAEQAVLVDTCGTGADSSGSFNISTAAALVAAAAGPLCGVSVLVAKHGNRAVTSQSGSADVLEALGIPVTLAPQAAAAALRTHHFAFLHAPSLHPAMKAVMPVRRALGVRTVFNVLGPLTNPAGARAQVMGVYSALLVPVVAEAMALLGVRHAFVVHGNAVHGNAVHGNAVHSAAAPDGSGALDEISISGPSQLAEVRGGTVTFLALTPEELGLQTAPIDSLRGGDAPANAAILRAIFAGEKGPRRDVVLLNAAAVLVTAGAVSASADTRAALRAGIALAGCAIDSGAVTHLVDALAADR
jgi:anthranilate phosphoribosyltransferase